MPITATQRDTYFNQGYLVVENVIPQLTLARIRDQIRHQVLLMEKKIQTKIDQSKYETSSATAAVPQVRKLTSLALTDPFLKEVVSSNAILDIVAELAGNAESLYLYDDQAFLKPAFCGSEKPLHQDNSYFNVTPHDHGLTCWIAIDDATEQNGCLRYIPGSQKLGLVEHKDITSTPHLVPSNRESLNATVVAPVPAGGAIFHHLLTMHESLDNRSSHPRWGWALHYLNGAADGCKKTLNEMLQVRNTKDSN